MRTTAKMMMTVAVAGFLAAGAWAQQDDNLIANPDFSMAGGNGRAIAWEFGDNACVVDTVVVPEGCKASASLTLKEMKENYGSIMQSIKGLKENTAYILTAKVKGTVAGMGFLEVKRHAGGKELARIDSSPNAGTEWETITLEFNTEAAFDIEVLCRYYQSKQFVGQTIVFSDVRLVEKK